MSVRDLVRRPRAFLAGIGLAVLVFLLPSELHDYVWAEPGVEPIYFGSRPALGAAIAVLMAFWWITEAISIYLTALVPLICFPLLGVFGRDFAASAARAALPYVDPYIFLFLGGMGIAAAMQQWNLHRRIALSILRAIGTRPQRILAGMLVATGFLSMWISNTATAAMMLPIGMALMAQVEAQSGGQRRVAFGGALMLAIAYGANVGGMGTKIGTGPNALFCGVVSTKLGREIQFVEFLLMGVPFVLVFLPIVWVVLWRSGRRDAPEGDLGVEVIEGELERLGPVQAGEKVVLAVFVATAAAWMLSSVIHPWLAALVAEPLTALGVVYRTKHTEAGIAMAATVALLLLPAPRSLAAGRGWTAALRLRQLRVIPWLTLILLGGGFALAQGIEASGLSRWMGERLSELARYPRLVQFVGVCLVTVFFGAIASNVATTSVMMVVLMSAEVSGVLPLMATATLAASCDFMLPAGTPPNAIVFGSGYLTIPRMARTGFFLDLAAALLVALWGWVGISRILA